jgi:hypothetical protein
MPDDQTSTPLTQRFGQLADRLENEFDAPVGAVGQLIEDPGIEHEYAVNVRRCAQSGGKRRIVLIPKITPKPTQSASQFRHGCAGYRQGRMASALKEILR